MAENKIERLLEKPYWLIDIVPKRISAEKNEEYSLLLEYSKKHGNDIRDRFVFFLLKLNCYCDMEISRDHGETFFPFVSDPFLRTSSEIFLLIDGISLLTWDREDTYMTLYDPDDELLERVEKLAGSLGLFVWKG